MRNRTFVLVLVAAVLAIGAGAARAAPARDGDAAGHDAAVVRSSDVAAVVVAARMRDPRERDGERRLDASALVGGIGALAVAAWWVAVRRRPHVHGAWIRVNTRPRAPPALVVPSS